MQVRFLVSAVSPHSSVILERAVAKLAPVCKSHITHIHVQGLKWKVGCTGLKDTSVVFLLQL